MHLCFLKSRRQETGVRRQNHCASPGNPCPAARVRCREIPPVLCFHTYLRLHLHSCTAGDCGLPLTLVLDYRLPTPHAGPYRLFSCTFRVGTSFLSPFELRWTPHEPSFSKGGSQETGVRSQNWVRQAPGRPCFGFYARVVQHVNSAIVCFHQHSRMNLHFAHCWASAWLPQAGMARTCWPSHRGPRTCSLKLGA